MDNMDHGRGFFPGPAFDAHHGNGTTLGWVILALQLLMLAALAVLLVRAFTRRGPRFGGPPPWLGHRGRADPLEHLRMRYARGEISRDEYLQATTDLGGDASTAELP